MSARVPSHEYWTYDTDRDRATSIVLGIGDTPASVTTWDVAGATAAVHVCFDGRRSERFVGTDQHVTDPSTGRLLRVWRFDGYGDPPFALSLRLVQAS